MQSPHRYKLQTIWRGNRGEGTGSYRAYGRDYTVRIPGKPDLAGSADPTFRGSADLHNPEDLLLAALSACHMLSYLHVCATAKIIVTQYEDSAEGTMELDGKGGGRFTDVLLRPRVIVTAPEMVERAERLHERAGEMCFIRSSCNFPVRHAALTTSEH
ncbi:MAG: OsmC family protein [bacterium]|nr:OsmC family protein [bacterium]